MLFNEPLTISVLGEGAGTSNFRFPGPGTLDSYGVIVDFSVFPAGGGPATSGCVPWALEPLTLIVFLYSSLAAPQTDQQS